MVLIENKHGDFYRGKQAGQVYQGTHGRQMRRGLKSHKDANSPLQHEVRDRFKEGTAWWASLNPTQKAYLREWVREHNIRGPGGHGTTAYTYAKRICMVTPRIEYTFEEGGPPPGEDLYLFFDGAEVPSGWELASGAGGAFYEKFIRGAASGGGTGGAATHGHTITGFSVGGGGTQQGGCCGSSGACWDGHSHGQGSVSCGTANNLPAYLNLMVIKYPGVPESLPEGVIALFADQAPPSGWTRHSAADDRNLRGAATSGGTGGSDTHTHTVSGTTGGANQPASYYSKSPRVSVASEGHTHAVSRTTAGKTSIPPSLKTTLYKLGASGALPASAICMFLTDPGEGWEIQSGAGGPFNEKFIRGAATHGDTVGAATHNEDNVGGNTGSTGGFSGPYNDPDSGYAASGHSHSLNISLQQTVSHIPPYIDVILAKGGGGSPEQIMSTLTVNHPAIKNLELLNGEETVYKAEDLSSFTGEIVNLVRLVNVQQPVTAVKVTTLSGQEYTFTVEQ